MPYSSDRLIVDHDRANNAFQQQQHAAPQGQDVGTHPASDIGKPFLELLKIREWRFRLRKRRKSSTNYSPHHRGNISDPSPAPPLASSECDTNRSPALDGTANSQDYTPVVEKGQPSTFAQALFISASETPQPSQQLYAPPWLAFITDEALVETFSRPSPDDVV